LFGFNAFDREGVDSVDLNGQAVAPLVAVMTWHISGVH